MLSIQSFQNMLLLHNKRTNEAEGEAYSKRYSIHSGFMKTFSFELQFVLSENCFVNSKIFFHIYKCAVLFRKSKTIFQLGVFWKLFAYFNIRMKCRTSCFLSK